VIETQRRILLVEDNPNDVELTLRAFARHGLQNAVDVARDGAEALDYLRADGSYAARAGLPLPALVLLDIKLPKIDGLEVLRRIRADARLRRVPVVFLTSSAEEQDKVLGYDYGANSYVRKPIDFARFLEAVRELGVYWLLLNEPVR